MAYQTALARLDPKSPFRNFVQVKLDTLGGPLATPVTPGAPAAPGAAAGSATPAPAVAPNPAAPAAK